MTGTPVEVRDALFARLRERFTEAELVELTSAIAWENYRARFDHAFGIEGENFSEGAVCAMPVHTAR
jgi:alkylhydroperoxidase family enzyme